MGLAEQRESSEAAELMTRTVNQIVRVIGADYPITRREDQPGLINQELSGDDTGQHVVLLDHLTRILGKNHPAVATLRRGAYILRTIDPHPF